jgi:hypothetical protein
MFDTSGSLFCVGGPRYYKYHMQRLQTTANHVLFYVVDAQDNAHLAIVVSHVIS